jgi:putative hydrolase of the HAD superfamily
MAQSRVFWADPEDHRYWRLRLFASRRETVARAFRALADAGRPTPSLVVADALADRFSAWREEQMSLFPDAHKVIDALKARGLKLALVTNGEAQLQRAKISRFDLAGRKPEERAYQHAMQALGFGPSETWMVGDNLEWEVVAPQRLGIYAVWHDHAGRGLPSGTTARPDLIIRVLSELIPALGAISG